MAFMFSHSPEAIKEKLNEILESSEFQKGLFERVYQWVGQVMYTIYNRLSSIHIGDVSLFWYLIGLITAILFIFLIYWVVQALRGGTIDATGKELIHGKKHGVFQPKNVSLDQARILARDEKYADALRIVYSTALAKLEAKGILKVDMGTTDRKYMAMVYKRAPEMFSVFSKLTNLIEKKWYGMEACSRDDFNTAMDMFSQLNLGGPGGGGNE